MSVAPVDEVVDVFQKWLHLPKPEALLAVLGTVAANQMDGDPVWIAPDRDLRQQQRTRAMTNLAPADPPEGFYLREVRQGMVNALISWELEEQHEFGRQAGVRILHPYWDPDLIDMLYRTPPDRLMRGGRQRHGYNKEQPGTKGQRHGG